MLMVVQVIVGAFGIATGIDFLRRPRHYAEKARLARTKAPRWTHWYMPQPTVGAYWLYGVLSIATGVGMLLWALI